MENVFTCAACCEAALGAAPHDPHALETSGGIAYACETSAEGFGRTCGYRGHFTCACKAATTSSATSECAAELWAPDVIAQAAARMEVSV